MSSLSELRELLESPTQTVSPLSKWSSYSVTTNNQESIESRSWVATPEIPLFLKPWNILFLVKSSRWWTNKIKNITHFVVNGLKCDLRLVTLSRTATTKMIIVHICCVETNYPGTYWCIIMSICLERCTARWWD